MPRTRNPYPAEFREQIVVLARAGRGVESLAWEFEPYVTTIHGWLKHAGLDACDRSDGLTSDERMRCAVFSARTGSCARSAISFQRQRLGLLRTM